MKFGLGWSAYVPMVCIPTYLHVPKKNDHPTSRRRLLWSTNGGTWEEQSPSSSRIGSFLPSHHRRIVIPARNVLLFELLRSCCRSYRLLLVRQVQTKQHMWSKLPNFRTCNSTMSRVGVINRKSIHMMYDKSLCIYIILKTYHEPSGLWTFWR